MEPKLIKGRCHKDERGSLFFNNYFDASTIKRFYIIENSDVNLERAWQGHKIEQRWFSAVKGKFIIKLIKIDNWEKPSKNLPIYEFELNSDSLDILHIPSGFVSYIKANEDNSKLLVLANYFFEEISDEYRYPLNHFL